MSNHPTADISKRGAFDGQRPPAPELISQCVHCGFCLPTCPTYALWGEEMDSPRGRIYLMKAASEGETRMTPQFVRHFDTCLGCMACMTACPSGVEYDKLIEATRAQIERNHMRPVREKLYRRMLFATFTRPERLRLLRWPLRAYQRTGLRALAHASGVLRLLPEAFRAMEALLPHLGASETISEVTPALGQRRRRVGLLLGCVQREFLPHLNAATVRVLAAEGCEIVAPAAQSCCGALMVHAGEEPPAMELARRMIGVFELASVEMIVTNAAGCGSNVKEYGHLLRDDPAYAQRAKAFAAKCKDVSEVLAELPPRATRRPIPWAVGKGKLRVAFHDSCHLQHAQGVRSQPRALLAQIPGVELVEIPESAICCGSAGIYNLVQPKAANALGDRKAALIADLDCDVVATGNPGCMLQLQASLNRAGKKIPVMHTVELLDAARA
ncbi:MAG TPA: glycolate oxidase subunit GlcF [Candidatus Acidoferrum sp.]|nr:glycolate oxidase subunit GlcF [Candidatus Acidoferrum sp.]